MSQHDYVLDNALFPATRADINSALAAIKTKNSGTAAPSTTGAYLEYANTTDGVIYRRDSGDAAWIKIDTTGTRVVSKTTTYAVLIGDYGKTILCDASSGGFTVTLPTVASAGIRFPLRIKKIDSTANVVTIDGNGSETIDGALTKTLDVQYQEADLDTNGVAWYIVGSYNDLVSQVEDARTNTVRVAHTVRATTSGTPANNIGVGQLFQAESADESPSDFGQIEFPASDITAGSEDTFFRILTRRAGAALAAAYEFITTSAFKYTFTGAPTANRTITLPDSDFSLTNSGAVLISTATASASSTIDFTSIDNTNYDAYIIVGDNLIPGTNATALTFRMSVAGTFDSGGTSYEYGVFRFTSSGSGVGGSTGASGFDLANNETLATAATATFGFTMTVLGVNNNGKKQCVWQTHGLMASTAYVTCVGGGRFLNSSSVVDGFRFLMSSGTIASGTFKLYGLKKS